MSERRVQAGHLWSQRQPKVGAKILASLWLLFLSRRRGKELRMTHLDTGERGWGWAGLGWMKMGLGAVCQSTTPAEEPGREPLEWF